MEDIREYYKIPYDEYLKNAKHLTEQEKSEGVCMYEINIETGERKKIEEFDITIPSPLKKKRSEKTNGK